MGVRDRSLDHLITRHVIPWERFGMVLGTEPISGVNTGAPVANEISSLGLTGISMEVGDMIDAMDFHTPCVMNPDYEIGVRVLWLADVGTTVATDACTWLVTYDQVDPGEVLVAPATALDTVIAAQTEGSVVGVKLHRTSRGVINAGSMDWTARTGIIDWRVESDAVTTYAAGEITFLGLEIDYHPKLFVDGNEDYEVFRNLAAVNTA